MVEAPLRRTLVAWYGATLGRDAAQHALERAWAYRSRLDGMDNPAGYLFRVGQSHAKRELRRSRVPASSLLPTTVVDGDSPFEPETTALATLSEQQRAAVLLVHGYGYSFREAADVLDVSLSTLRTALIAGWRVCVHIWRFMMSHQLDERIRNHAAALDLQRHQSDSTPFALRAAASAVGVVFGRLLLRLRRSCSWWAAS